MPPATARRGPAALPALLAVGAVVIAVVGAVLAAFSVRQVSAANRATDDRAAALAAARQIAVDFAAYDYRRLAEDFKHVADETVGKLHQQYLTGSTGLQDQIEKVQAVATAEVTASAVTSVSASQATVLLSLDRLVKTKQQPNGQSESVGLQMVLVHRGGQWLASELAPM
jgi:Mce-associated membrane protein